jgi:serine protease AprX
MRTGRIRVVLVAVVAAMAWASVAGAQGVAEDAPIRLRGTTFFPSRGEPALPPGLRQGAIPAGARGTWIVQFAGPIQETWKQAATAAGAELVEYIPEFAFKARMSPAQAQAVRRLAPVRWVGAFHPAYKLSPRLTRSWRA